MSANQEQMTNEEIKEYQENQLMALRYKMDMREVMKKKLQWSNAPMNMNALALNVDSNSPNYGKWIWLKNEILDVNFVFMEKRPIEFVERNI